MQYRETPLSFPAKTINLFHSILSMSSLFYQYKESTQKLSATG